ncbi:MAG: gamma-glutamyl-gamma-aminobutyrate hydrolase family protein [Verrucomicrobia bacterium]|nr:gamma-glutamyl-gamma-aminobutyrate hydrolase family protein [Verrucomicrobiota bacterium]
MPSPLILVTPCQQRQGAEFADSSISLSNRYTQAIADAGGLPLVLPVTATREQVADCVRRADGVMLTGGEDIEAKHYAPNLAPNLAATIKETEPERDAVEFALVEEVFRQRKPGALPHKQLDRKMEPVHDITLAPDSRLSALLGETRCGVNSTHHQAVDRVAGELCVTASSADGVIEAMELKDAAKLPFLVSVQFHPERLYDRWPKFAKIFREFIRVSGASR